MYLVSRTNGPRRPKKTGRLPHRVLPRVSRHAPSFPLLTRYINVENGVTCLDLSQDTKGGHDQECIEVLREMYLARGKCPRDEQPVNKRVSRC